MKSGELAVKAIEEKLASLMDALNEAVEVNVGYEQIIEVATKYPPFSELHLAQLEQNLVLARQQLADLSQCRKTLYTDAEKMDVVCIVYTHPLFLSLFFFLCVRACVRVCNIVSIDFGCVAVNLGEEEAVACKDFVLSPSKVESRYK